VIIEEEKGIASGALSTFLSSSLNIELVYIILAGITRFSQSSLPNERVSHSCNTDSIAESSFNSRQMENLTKVPNPYDHIRSLQLNKIRICNARKWDVAKYDEFLATGKEAYT
jgi:hypothetical protein